MKLVLSEYISALKEDKELDLLVVNLLKELDFLLLIIPQRGRQFGVDIVAAGIDPDRPDSKEALFLLIVKQGNITRTSWGQSETGVRSSLEEVKDVYLNNLVPDKYKDHAKKIIVVSNGHIEQNVNINWVSYTNSNSTDLVSYDYWGIDKLVLLAEKAQFSETLFPEDIRSLLRKSLALLDLSEYDYRHFYELIHKLTSDSPSTKKQTIKIVRLINSCISIVFNWAKGYNNVKPALIIAERVLLLTWQWIQKGSFSEDKEIVNEYLELVTTKTQIDYSFFLKVKDAYSVEDGLAYTHHRDHVEYCLLTYEQIGIISSMGLTQLWYAEVGLLHEGELLEGVKVQFKSSEVIADVLCQLIDNNPASLYPKLDEHCIDINLALILLHTTGRTKAAVAWLTNIIHYLALNHKLFSFFPLWHTDYEKLAAASYSRENLDPESSILAVVLAEWCLIFKRDDLYHNLRYVVTDQIKGINLQLWKPDSETESIFYSQNATSDTGETKVSIQLHKNHREYLMEMTEELVLWKEEFEMSFIKTGMTFLGYLAFRHHRTYVFPSLWRRFLNSPFCFNSVRTE